MKDDGATYATADGPQPTRRLLSLLLLAYTVNFMDRTVVSTLAQAIKVDLKITDAQLGLLQGFAFVVLYSIAGIPIARLSERYNRVTIMSVCIAAWSALTMLCGTAANFTQLLLFRVGVGVGEAGCNAPSHSMIADAFPPRKRAGALGVYNFGTALGTMIGAMSGGLIAQYLSWRMAFVIVGAPGLVLALVMRLLAREPARTALPVAAAAAPTPAVAHRNPRALDVARLLAANPATRHLILGFTLVSFTIAGSGSFAQPYFIRNFGLTYAQIGVIFGFFSGLAAGASIVTSGKLADYAVQRDVRWHAWLPAVGVAVSVPLTIIGYILPSWPMALVVLMLSGLFVNWFIAPTWSGIHKIVGPRAVAMAVVLVLLFQNLLGLGGGPYVTGLAIDALAQHQFGQAGLGDFFVQCPGGAAVSGAPAALAEACHTTLAHATRQGILLTVLGKIWAVLHFLIAARHIAGALAAAERARPDASGVPA